MDEDLFGSDSEDGDAGPAAVSPAAHEVFNALFTILVKQRNRNKGTDEAALGDLRIGVALGGSDSLKVYADPLLQKLKAAKFSQVSCVSSPSELSGLLDVAVCFSSEDIYADDFWRCVVPGGLLASMVPAECASRLAVGRWVSEHDPASAAVADAEYTASIHRKRPLQCNQDGALYWATLSDQLQREAALAGEVTVCLSTHERAEGCLSDASVNAAAAALSVHGVCIIRGLFDPAAVARIAPLALGDLAAAKQELLKRGIDLTKPGCGGPPINNFHELSMREAYRVDLRNGSLMRSPREGCPHTAQQDPYFRNNASVLRILEKVMNPAPEEVPAGFRGGNWGRWNFGGLGPDAPPPPPVVGEMGAVVTLPGCLDQTVHADTAHLFDHVQLPAHYINMFIPGVVGDVPEEEYMRIGQTAFICGSHELETSARLMNTGDEGETELESRLLRPHVDPGDVYMFDCRVLHFGLANKSAQIERPVLYVNYHHPSFRDPKNWNDAERLFSS